jgi:hypothetical protein
MKRSMRLKPGSRLPGLLICLVLFSGCSGYGRIAAQRGETETITIDHLVSAFDRYDVYFMEASYGCSPLLVFDPKADDRILQSGDWEEVRSKDALPGFLHRIRREGFGEVYLLLGPEGRRYGFLYAADENRIYSRAIDENSLELYMKASPCRKGAGPSGP